MGVMTFIYALVELPSFPIFCLYLLMIGGSSWWQKLSTPLDLRLFLIAYNVVCSALSTYTFGSFLYALIIHQDLFDKSPSHILKPVFYMYWITKMVELLDTVFMILRHRRRQITILHVYHHASMLLLSDYAYRFAPWPAVAFFLCLNSLVHIVLYSYYALTAIYPTTQLSWKQRLTEMQILQFFIDMVFAAEGYRHHGFCIYGIFYGLIMTYLFCNFYYVAYLKPRPVKRDKPVTNDKHD